MTIDLRYGDTIEQMKLIPDKSIDFICCDLPYGSTKNYWDVVIPFNQLWEQYERIIKENGAIVLFGQDKFSAKVMLSNEKLHRYNLIWDKGNRGSGFLNAKRMPLRNHEDIMVFYKKLPIYNPQMTVGDPLHGMGKKYKLGNLQNNNYGNFDSHKNPSADRVGDTNKFPKSIIKFNKPHPPIHPTQKSTELIEWLVKTYSNENDVVLDNTFGSCTTGIACINTNRNFIGIENNMDYFNISLNRVEEKRKEKEFNLITSFGDGM
jgi:site-specific DNA-methyltransferase (adenine-specific)